MMRTIHRRDFLTHSAVAFSALTALGAAKQPNDRIRVAVMGVHGRGKDLAGVFSQSSNCEVACICDVDDSVIGPAAKVVEINQKKSPKIEKDIRRVLEQKDIDAIVIATPDHWHALATIWACERGKHVYVEKPVSHNVVEGRKMVEAARKYNRIVQVGTQRRTAPIFQKAVEYVRSGNLGKVPFAQAFIAGARKSIGKKPDGPVPPGVEYDLWLGPAPLRPFNPNRFHYHWHWNWDYGTGELGNNGIHLLDICRWGLGVDSPKQVTCGGGKHFFDDDQQTPDTQIATFDFAHCSITWEHRTWAKPGRGKGSYGIAFYGEKGNLIYTGGEGWQLEADGIQPFEPETKGHGGMDADHVGNFVDSVRSGKRPNADIEDGHKTTTLCHLGNISWKLGRTLQFDGRTERIAADEEANALLARGYRKGFEL